MEDIIIEEFTEYKVYLYDTIAHGPDFDEAIVIPFSRGLVRFVFYHSGEHVNRVEDNAAGQSTYFIYVPTRKFDRFIDILRYEKPLYIALDHENVQAYVTTEFEPVGEGDMDHS